MEEFYARFVAALGEAFPQVSFSHVLADLEGAVRQLGILVKYSDMTHLDSTDEISGYATVENGRPKIVVNGFHNEARRRFTIAHELGHILLHWNWLPGEVVSPGFVEVSTYNRYDGYYSPEEKVREREANNFAIELLAPQEAVRAYLKQITQEGYFDEEAQAVKVSEQFKISRPAARIRLREVA